jgi:outer membrane protein assembly factor BamB
MRTTLLIAWLGFGLCLSTTRAADWPQWRGPNRDAQVAEFQVPAAWPQELTKKWSVSVGDGASTPALVGNKLYVFARQDGNEVLRCLDATGGMELWQHKSNVDGATDPGGFVGPRSSPAVAEGKVVTLSARGVLSCFDAATGTQLWSKDDFRGWPQFCAASSPIIVDGMCIAQVGATNPQIRSNNGTVVAYDLATGAEKWKVEELPTAYASPVLMTIAGTKLVIAQVSDGIVGINTADGKKVWEKFFEGAGSRYKAATPIVIGDTLIFLDGPAKAVKLEKEGDKFVDKDLWTNTDYRVEYNTPVAMNDALFGLSGGMGSGAHNFFCIDLGTGKSGWNVPAPRIAGAPAGAPPGGKGGGQEGGKGGGFGKGGFGKGGGGGMRADAGYGSIVAAGPVLIALTPSSDLIVFAPSDKEFKQLATYKVAESGTYAYPVLAGNRIYIKDKDAVTLWTIE